MKILLVTQWYAPVKAAAAKRTGKMARALTAAGHKVTVLTSFPSYPTGVVPKEYHWKLWTRSREEKIDIIRIWEYPTPSEGIVKRLLNMVTFVISAWLAAVILPVYDAVIVSSPSFLSGLAGLANAREKHVKFYFDVRDLWPDVTVDLGILKPGFILSMLKRLAHYFYRRAEKVFVATPGIKKRLFLQGVPLKKVEVLLNSADTDLFKQVKVSRPPEFNEKDFIVTYVGNHSRMYDLENVIQAARKLEKTRVKFLFIGEGETKSELKDLAQKYNLDNVTFYDQKPLDEIAPILAWSNLGLISLNTTKLAQETIPSKLAEYLSAGLPVVAGIGDEVKKLLEENEAGLIYEAGDPEALADTIIKLSKNPTLCGKLGKNARALALKLFSDKKFNQVLTKEFSA